MIYIKIHTISETVNLIKENPTYPIYLEMWFILKTQVISRFIDIIVLKILSSGT